MMMTVVTRTRTKTRTGHVTLSLTIRGGGAKLWNILCHYFRHICECIYYRLHIYEVKSETLLTIQPFFTKKILKIQNSYQIIDFNMMHKTYPRLFKYLIYSKSPSSFSCNIFSFLCRVLCLLRSPQTHILINTILFSVNVYKLFIF